MKSLVEFLKESMITEAEIYEGGKELSKFISKAIKDNPDKSFMVIDAKDIKDVKNIFFKYVLIYVNEEPIEEAMRKAGYNTRSNYKQTRLTLGNLLKWNNDEKMFNYVEFYFETLHKKDRDVDWEDVAHEVNHAWDDYQKRLEDPDKFLGCDSDLEEYDISRDLLKPESHNSIAHKMIGYIKYINTEFEKKSFVIQATEKFKSNLDKYDNYDDALEWQCKNNRVFIEFLFVRDEFYKCKNSKSLSELVCNLYRKNYKKDKDLSDKEVIDLLENLINDYFNAITENINKILGDHAKKTTI